MSEVVLFFGRAANRLLANKDRDQLIFRLPGAFARAGLVVLLIALPSLMLPGDTMDGRQVVTLVAIFAALFTIVEYSAASPSIIEFRDAPPFNRVRFCALFAIVLSLTLILRGYSQPSSFTDIFVQSGADIGFSLNFPFSPVNQVMAIAPVGTNSEVLNAIQGTAGLAYVISLLSIMWFVILLRLQHWPRRSGTFNVWVNLPTFDPTSGGDVVLRLKRDARINVFLGLLLPFLIPAIVNLIALLGAPVALDDPQTLIWTIATWAFLPAAIVMRGIALNRVAKMIKQQRRKAYDKASSDGYLPA